MQKLLQDRNIGINLRRLRDEMGYTQSDVCAKLGLMGREMSINTYSLIENGRRNIFVSDLILFKKIFNVSFDAFFEGLYESSAL